MSMRALLLATILSPFSMGVAQATVISIYTEQSAWQAALAGTTLVAEEFDGAAANFGAQSNANALGSVSIDVIGGVGDAGPTGPTGSGFLQGEVDASPIGSDDGLSLVIHHQPAIGLALLGLQNDSATNPGGLNLVEIGLQLDGAGFLVSDLLGLTDSASATAALDSIASDSAIPFLGFVLDQPLSSFAIVHSAWLYAGGVAGTSEEFYLDGLLFARAAQPQRIQQTELPVPGTAALLLAGLAGWRRRRR